MNRFLLSCAAAALLAAPVLAASAADAATTKHRTPHHAATSGRSPNKYTGYHGGDTPQGNAAVDQLNAQSLANARGGAAAAPAPAAR